MQATEIIAAKRDGKTLTDEQLRAFIRGYTDGTIPDYQASALAMAIFFKGMTGAELATWTDAMLHSGDVLDLSDIPGKKVDKHSTGGVGDKISLILAPLVAAAGVPVPMISGRGLGHTGGTLDKLESIPGFTVGLSVERFRELVATLQLGLIGQTGEIAPADKKLYALRDATSTVESIPLIASSIMSKKLAEGIDALVLDVKVGSGAFMKNIDRARELADTMIDIGQRGGREIVALITDMDQPLGAAIGNTLEVVESIEVLRGGGPADVRELTLALAAEMVVLGGVDPTIEAARARVEKLLDDGSALKRFRDVVEAQGGDVATIDDPSLLPGAKRTLDVFADTTGFVTGFDCADVGRSAMRLGAGRATKEDSIDPGVGLMLHVKRGDKVDKDTAIGTFYINDETNVEDAVAQLKASVHIGAEKPADVPLILERRAP